MATNSILKAEKIQISQVLHSSELFVITKATPS
jgi:hypothetical protein